MSEIAELKHDLKTDIGEVKTAVNGLTTEFQKFLVNNADRQATQNGKIKAAHELATDARLEAHDADKHAYEAKAFARKIVLYILAAAALGGGGVGASKAAAIARFFGG